MITVYHSDINMIFPNIPYTYIKIFDNLKDTFKYFTDILKGIGQEQPKKELEKFCLCLRHGNRWERAYTYRGTFVNIAIELITDMLSAEEVLQEINNVIIPKDELLKE